MNNRISIADYFAGHVGHPAITAEHRANAEVMLPKVNALLDELRYKRSVTLEINPKTGSLISGTDDGGWRPPDCPEGSPRSSHKQGRGVDVYDPDGDIDEAIDDDLLARYGLYREHPAQTKTWCHLSDRPPGSGRRTFYA